MAAADVPLSLIHDVIGLGARPGKALQRDLMLAGRKRPEMPLVRTTPFTRLPPGIFDKSVTRWKVLCQGRWRWQEHITIGELRAVLKLLLIIISCPTDPVTKL